ncbi:MAG: glycosyltransferase family 4 protein [Phycisphaerae bacterium]|nr:glycosyltransferase family 4 protein [Phycisphaerae bacterium]
MGKAHPAKDIMRPKILLFFEYGTLNGGEFSLLAMLRAMGQVAFEFVAAAPVSGMLAGRLGELGIEVMPLVLRDSHGRKRGIEEINLHLVEIITRVSPDLVHSNSLAMGRMVGRVASEVKIPCTSHLRDIIKLNKTVISDLNQNAALVAVSNATRQYHIDQGMAQEKVQVIYNGVDTELFCPAPKTGTIKRELGLSSSAVLCANIGQVCLRKGQTLLAQAAVSLAREFPEVNYLFVGERHSQKSESIKYENTIRQTFQDAGIEDRLFCLGFRRDIPVLLNEVDLLVHAAHQEPLGRVLLEAASCGQVIVATNVGGTPEILTDMVSALLAPSNDLDALVAAIGQMLRDRELRIRLGRQARTAAIEKFSLPAAAARVGAFWESFL